MRENMSTPAAARPGASLLGGVSAAVGTLAMGTLVRSLHELAQTSLGHETLILWVLLGLAVLGTVLCCYLALIWSLAAMIMLSGPASRTGATLLGPLRILAPRLARRLASGAAVATAATALTLAPGIAAQDHFAPDPELGTIPVTQTAELFSTEAPPTDPAPEAAAPGSSGRGTGEENSDLPLPPLGWGDASGSGATGTAAPSSADADASGTDSPRPGPHSSSSAPIRTVVVHQGDSLWSISDELLGPGPSDPAEIAAAWPLLHETNRDLIGDDPDRLHPGQQLTVPASMTTQDMS